MSWLVVNANVLSYMRRYADEDIYLVAINFGFEESEDDHSIKMSDRVLSAGEVVLNTNNLGDEYSVGRTVSLSNIKLSPAQGLVLKVSNSN